MRNVGESIGIGLAASSTSKGPQVKTTEPMVSIKVTNLSIQLDWILARGGFAKNYMRSRPEAKKCHFSFSACGWMDGCMLSLFWPTIFSTPLHRLKWNWKPTTSLTKWSADLFLVHIDPQTLVLYSSTILVFFFNILKMTTSFVEI